LRVQTTTDELDNVDKVDTKVPSTEEPHHEEVATDTLVDI